MATVARLGGIERDDERVVAREVSEQVHAPCHARDRIGQWSRHLVQEARLDQQPALCFRLLAEDLVHQVLANASRVKREFGDEVGGIIGALHSHGRQPHARRPSLGPRREDTEILLPQRDAMHREHFPDLRRCHGQVRRTQLAHLPGQPVPVQRQQRVTARG